MTSPLITVPQMVALPDADPDPEQSGDWWHLVELAPDPHEDYCRSDELPALLTAYRQQFASFSIRRLPGATESMLADAIADAQPASLRWHPSLSAAERNA